MAEQSGPEAGLRSVTGTSRVSEGSRRCSDRQEMLNGMTTRSPTSSPSTPGPTSATPPTASRPRMSPPSGRRRARRTSAGRNRRPGRRHRDDDVSGLLDNRVRHIEHFDVGTALSRQCFHRSTPPAWRAGRLPASPGSLTHPARAVAERVCRPPHGLDRRGCGKHGRRAGGHLEAMV